ncbi:hypothetical protein ACIGC1_07210 [Peribacillus butanolivorans]|uniref:hypothetical protein n=1 Tax=Peribacillus butanolivorans TaxID=421767 RepID=UPI0037C5F92F
MWEELKYTKAQARSKFEQLSTESNQNIPRNFKKPYDQLRQQLLVEIQLFATTQGIKIQSHAFDLYVGMAIYRILNEQYGFTERFAAQDEIWRFLSLEVFPDIVCERYGLTELRFYSGTRRIWLKIIWWYIHLSWQGTEDATFHILNGNSTDDLAQLIERSGSAGYRVDLSRELMKQYRENKQLGVHMLFRRVLKLNTARLKMIEPSLVIGGNKAYVSSLFDYFKENNETKTAI